MLSPRPWYRAALALLGLLLAHPGLSQLPGYDWQWGHPAPQGHAIFGLAFDGPQTGWAVARGGQVLRTDDGALTWQLIQPLGAVGDDLLDIVVLASGTLFACGDGIHRSEDGGFTWQELPQPATGLLYDLATIPGGGLSAAGADGTVVVSFDGGDSWASVGPGGNGLIRHHLWRSSAEAYVVGDFINRRTTDGGQTWQLTLDAPENFYVEVFFTGPDRGFIAEAFRYWTTEDGGDTWTAGAINDGGPLYRHRTLQLTADHWLVTAHGEGGELWETLDGGETWEQFHFTWHAGFPAIAAVPGSPGGRVVVSASNGSLFWSDDTGRTLTDAAHNVGADTIYGTISRLVRRPDGVLFAHGRPALSQLEPVWMRSDDGGLAWTDPGDWLPFTPTRGLTFLDASVGLAGGEGAIARTTDGGQSWTPASWSGSGTVLDFALPAADRFFAATGDGQGSGDLLRSSDGGQSWNPVGGGLPLGSFAVRTVSFSPDGMVGLVSGVAGASDRTYRSTDGGITWSPVGGLPGHALGLAWADPATVVAGTAQGLYRSVNAGASWSQVEATQLTGVVFRDGQRGAAWRLFGDLFLTDDGGQTWQPVAVPFYSPIPPLDTYTWIGSASWSEHGWVIGGAALRILVAGDGDLTPVEPDLPRGATSLVRLDAPWPNPFNPSTTLRYHLAADGPVLVTVHDVAGRLVRTLVRGMREAGAHSVTWHGTADTGRAAPAGVYLVRVVSRGEHDVVKVVLVE